MLNNSEVRIKAFNEIKKRRNKAKIKAMFNSEKMCRNKEYLKVQNEIGQLTIDIAKAKIANKAIIEYEKRLKIARKEEERILLQCGLTTQDLTPNYMCKICNDTGIVGTKWCKCLSDLISEYSGQTCNKVTYADCQQIDESILKQVKAITSNYSKTNPICNIVISGSVGVGKTYLAQAMQNELNKKEVSTIFTSATNLNSNFLEYHKCFNEDKNTYIQCYLDCDALFIDDLGTEPLLKNVTKEYLLMVIKERVAKQKLTIVTTNLKGSEFLQRYEERIFSHLLDKSKSLVIDIQGKDLRLQKRSVQNGLH